MLKGFDSLIKKQDEDTGQGNNPDWVTFFPQAESSDESRVSREIVLDIAKFFGLDASNEQEYAKAEIYAEKQKGTYKIASLFDSLRNVHHSLRDRPHDLGSFLFVVSDGTYATSILSERMNALQEVHFKIDSDYKGLDDRYFDMEQNIRLLDDSDSRDSR